MLLKRYLVGVLIAANQLVNSITGGDPQMSMSARAGFARANGNRFAAAECRFLDLLDVHHPNPKYPETADHCDIAILDYYERKAATK